MPLSRDIRYGRRCFRRWLRRNPYASLIDKASTIMRCYDPKARFDIHLGQWSWTHWENVKKRGKYVKDKVQLHWRVGHGLHTLFHELGHIYHNHWYERVLPLQWSEYMCEIEAWVWAERECHLSGIPFDYVDAARALEKRRLNLGIPPVIQPWWKYMPKEESDDD